MANTPIPIPNANSIDQLEDMCNFIETHLPGHLKSLKAETNAGQNVTRGIFDRLDDVEPGLGELEIKPDNGATDTAWINNIRIKVSFS